MSTHPNTPRVSRGAIVGLDPVNPLASVIVFQYNPYEMSRNVKANASGGAKRGEPYKLAGAPNETISISVEVDASDQLEVAEGTAVNMGIYPQLSALEMLLYPKSAFVIANTALAQLGAIEILPPDSPMTLFIWGMKRVLPVRISGLNITETYHDVNLNPIQASVKLDMQVLTYNHFDTHHPGYHLFLTHQIVKETMATIGSINNLSNL